MEFSQLSVAQQIAAHELELHALRNAVRHQQKVISSLIELLGKPTTSPEFFAQLKALMVERDRHEAP